MKKLISLILALLTLIFCLAACGSEEKKSDDAHDPALVGYWISDKKVSVDGKETTDTDVSGEVGIEIYENGMIRIMERNVNSDTNRYTYIPEAKYCDYMIIGEGQIACLSTNSSGEKYITIIFEYSVKDGVLTLLRYYSDGKEAVSYKRLETPFYKYFPEVPADGAQGGSGVEEMTPEDN